ncbi:hypothetical protein BDV95DRAFT_644964 [Massariosphaeria phaeospora]|uniref:Ubiquitin-like protease family profile domain-containing protein n=1 Tax=Massariosphaeria phaeospora TaxID=100035 RepID=A0A7C8IHW4_9PLEO|nr:hypothetical protein BDV95DRAFT_644964 [Massariosphaeria phaeospora]
MAETLLRAKTNEGKRWIVAPCSDGMMGYETLARRDELEKKAAGSGRKVPNANVGRGLHWGLLIVDRLKKRAHFIDGHLELREVEGEYNIHRMYHAGTAAGKVLCALDRVFEYTPGEFETSTLKFVPADREDNAFKGDNSSACGPYVYAFFNYLLNHPEYLDDLEESFKISEWEKHKRDLEFHSLQVRREMQALVQTARDGSEAVTAAGQETAGVQQNFNNTLPLLMSLPVLKALGADGMRDAVLGFEEKHNPPRKNETRNNDGDGTDDHDTSDDDDDDDQTKRDTLIEARSLGIKGLHNKMSLKRIQQQIKSFMADQKAIEESLAGAHKADKTAVPSIVGGHIVKPRKETNDGLGPAKVPLARQYHSGDATHPRDFATMGKRTLTEWIKKIPGLFKDHEDADFETKRAVIHRYFKGTFDKESDANLQNAWQNDPFTTKAEDSREPGEIKGRLFKRYEQLVVPNFWSSERKVIDRWLRNLPKFVRELVTDRDRNILYERAKALLYRVFVNDFEDMSDADVTAWRTSKSVTANDPLLLKTGAEVRNGLKARHSNLEKLYYYRNSPLHWPDEVLTIKLPGKGPKLPAGNQASGSSGPLGEAGPSSAPKQPKRPREDDDKDNNTLTAPTKRARTTRSAFTRPTKPQKASTAVPQAASAKEKVADEKASTAVSAEDRAANQNALFEIQVAVEKKAFPHEHENKTDEESRAFVRAKLAAKPAGASGPENNLLEDSDESFHNSLSPSPEPSPAKTLAEILAPMTPAQRNTLPGKAVNFTHKSAREVDLWVAKKASRSLNPKEGNLWQNKTVLQHLFGGFAELTKNDIAHWRDQHPGFAGNRNASEEEVRDELVAQTEDIEKEFGKVGFPSKLEVYGEIDGVEVLPEKKKKTKRETKRAAPGDGDAGPKKKTIEYPPHIQHLPVYGIAAMPHAQHRDVDELGSGGIA